MKRTVAVLAGVAAGVLGTQLFLAPIPDIVRGIHQGNADASAAPRLQPEPSPQPVRDEPLRSPARDVALVLVPPRGRRRHRRSAHDPPVRASGRDRRGGRPRRPHARCSFSAGALAAAWSPSAGSGSHCSSPDRSSSRSTSSLALLAGAAAMIVRSATRGRIARPGRRRRAPRRADPRRSREQQSALVQRGVESRLLDRGIARPVCVRASPVRSPARARARLRLCRAHRVHGLRRHLAPPVSPGPLGRRTPCIWA